MNAAHTPDMAAAHPITQTVTKTLVTEREVDWPAGVPSRASLAKRQARLNELGADGWSLATTIFVDGVFIDTLQQSAGNKIPF